MFTSDSVGGRGKPHPDIYLAAARGLGKCLLMKKLMIRPGSGHA